MPCLCPVPTKPMLLLLVPPVIAPGKLHSVLLTPPYNIGLYKVPAMGSLLHPHVESKVLSGNLKHSSPIRVRFGTLRFLARLT